MAVVGTVLYFSSRKRSSSSGTFAGLGRAQLKGRTKSGGMTLSHYRGRMPIKHRLKIIQDLTWKSVQDPQMRKLALRITNDCPERDGKCEARAIYNWMKANVRYTGDVAAVKQGHKGPYEGVDLFQSAARTVEMGGGDCDDHSILAATLLTLNGITARFRVTARAPKAEWSHIFVTFGNPKMGPSEWISFDSTLPGSRFGQEAPSGRKADFPA